jgi:hypothetical protein
MTGPVSRRPARLVPITEDEADRLIEQATDGRILPLAWGTAGCAIESDGSGTALWALARLAEMRGVDQ